MAINMLNKNTISPNKKNKINVGDVLSSNNFGDFIVIEDGGYDKKRKMMNIYSKVKRELINL